MTTKNTATALQLVCVAIVLMISWLIWSGFFKPLLISLGIFSCLLSLWLATRMGFFRHAMPVRSLIRLPRLWLWVAKEVVESSFEVARVILSPSLPIKPQLIEFKTSEKSDSGKVIIGNSITLSPGTVTIDVHGDRLLVHCLTEKTAAGLLTREVEKRTAQLEIE